MRQKLVKLRRENSAKNSDTFGSNPQSSVRSKPYKSSETVFSDDFHHLTPSRQRRYKSDDEHLHKRRQVSGSLPNSTAILRYELLKSPIIHEMDGSTDAKNVEEASVRMASTHEVVPRLDFGKDGGSINYSLSQKSIHEADGNEIGIFRSSDRPDEVKIYG